MRIFNIKKYSLFNKDIKILIFLYSHKCIRYKVNVFDRLLIVKILLSLPDDLLEEPDSCRFNTFWYEWSITIVKFFSGYTVF